MSPFIETIRIEHGAIQNLSYHNQRMNATRKALFGPDTLIDLADSIQPDNCLQRTKCRIEYNKDILMVDYAPYQIRPVHSLRLLSCDAIDYPYKSTNRSALNALFADRGEADDILIIRNGLLTDTSICNIALWNGETWVTPAMPLLPGTMRASLLNAGKIIPSDIRPEDLPDYSRIRLFNAMIGFGEVEITFASAQTVPMPRILSHTYLV